MNDASASLAYRSGITALQASIFCVLSFPLALLFVWGGFVSADDGALGSFVSLSLFVAQDMWAGPVMALAILAAWRWGNRLGVVGLPASRATIWALAAVSVALAVVLRFLAHHNYGLSLDEAMARFQAAIFRGGHLLAPLNDEAFALRDQLQPFLKYVDEEHQLWASHYRPVHAAILSVFPEGADVAIAHALLTGLTVLAIADIARRLFPDRPDAPFLAVVLLIGSPQVLLTAASGFSFTTHLAFNTVWLALFLRGTWRSHITAAAVGFFALGIHQVHVHAIYVFPFGVAMLLGYFGSRWKAVPYVVAYAVAVPLWITWPEVATYLQTGDAGVLPQALIEVDYLANYLDRSSGPFGRFERDFSLVFLIVNVWRFFLWMSPAVVLLVALSLFARRRLGAIAVISALGFLFTVATSHVLMPNQMHTIGSRYYHPAIANVIVVALAAYYALADSARLRGATVALALAGVAIFLPWRAFHVHEKVGPRAAVQARLDAMGAETLIIRNTGAWFMADLIRNDPFLRDGPFYYVVPPDFVERGIKIVPLTDGPRAIISGEDLLKMGLPRGTYLEPAFELNSR